MNDLKPLRTQVATLRLPRSVVVSKLEHVVNQLVMQPVLSVGQVAGFPLVGGEHLQDGFGL